jgi:GTPase involved in cell partitioning and DNA repair
MNLKLENTRYEISSWLRMLSYQQQEIIDMKTRIAGVIKENVGQHILEELEEFQNIFLAKDTVIAFFKRDIVRLNEELQSESAVPTALHIIREDIPKMELEFNILKKSFNDCIEKIL